MTEKLYDSFPYEKVFKACVRDIIIEDTYPVLVLDKTLFFPLEGGQTCDKGSIEGMTVVDVQIKNDIVYHTIDADIKAFYIGQCVEGIIDWSHRFSNMQQHSAEHIFSGLVHKYYGFDNCGFHLSDNICTMDFSGPLSKKSIQELELGVNEAIWQNVPTRSFYPSSEEQSRLKWRSKGKIVENLRLVEIEGYDLCACCAPHVAKTGEIGIFKVLSFWSYKGGVRISYLAGKRAYMYIRSESELLSGLYKQFSANSDTLQAQIDTLYNDNNAMKQSIALYKEKEIQNIIYSAKSSIVFLDNADINIARRLALDYTKEVNQDLFIFIQSEKGYKYILSTSSQDAKNIQMVLQERLAARGGGNNCLVSGSLCATMEDISDVMQEFTDKKDI